MKNQTCLLIDDDLRKFATKLYAFGLQLFRFLRGNFGFCDRYLPVLKTNISSLKIESNAS